MGFLHVRRPQPLCIRRPFLSRRALAALLVLAALLAVPALPAAAQEEAPPEMSAEQQAMMQAWVKAMTPGEQHEKLAGLAGDYTMTVKTWMDPEGEPEVAEGTATYEMILGGRVLQETVNGSMMGQPFEGRAMTGYDNIGGKYWSTWVDNMSTSVTVGEGDYDDSGALVMHSQYMDAVSGEAKKVRTVTRHNDDGSILFQWFEPAEGGEKKTMEIVYQPK